MGWLGLDDTDSLKGGCTTEVLYRLIQSLPQHVGVGQARLVRLWPFARRRTRGNAAVAVELSTTDEPALLAFLDEYWFNHLLPLKGTVEESEHSERKQYPSDPGMVWFTNKIHDDDFYRKGLREEIKLEQLPIPKQSWGGHGRIGATLAVLWPADRTTFEAIAWRESTNNGPRRLDREALKQIEEMSETFLCRDDRLGTNMLAPRGASPVLFGIRTWTQDAANEALQVLLNAPGTEDSSGSIVFETNHATNDHLDEPIQVRVENVEILKGGHTVIHANNDRFVAFKESGEIARICQQLQPDDILECNGLMSPDHSIHIEIIRIRHLISNQNRPSCPTCQKALSSMGVNQGLRCKKCGFKTEDAWIETPRDLLTNQWIQPPASARRHLAKPLDESPTVQNNL
jgi:tRNA(Ile2)-agmatinylcytidine synthase